MPRKNKEREDRIAYEVVVDCYNEMEVAMGWYYYLQDNLDFPFDARISKSMRYNPLARGDIVKVISMADEDECEDAMWVTVETTNGEFDVPLEQVDPIHSSSKAGEAVEDWRYWLDRGYSF